LAESDTKDKAADSAKSASGESTKPAAAAAKPGKSAATHRTVSRKAVRAPARKPAAKGKRR
jgi:hypothetical protein